MRSVLRFTRVFLLVSLLAACSASPSATPVSAPTPGPSPEPKVEESPLPVIPTPEHTLAAGQWNTLFYHPQLEKVILVNGGPDRGKPAGDPLELWAWDGSSWTLLSADPQGPRWRNFAGAAFDTERNVLVIHGGLQDAANRMEDTWEWDGQSWKQFSGSGPGFREDAEMVFDEARGNTILFGGANEDFEMMADTWAWDGSRWTQVSSSGPAPRFPIAMANDAVRKKVLLFGGHAVSGNDFVNYNDLWEWDGTAWRELLIEGDRPTVRLIAEMEFDPVGARLLLFGGGEDAEFFTDMWAWDGTAWTQAASSGAPARSGMSAAYDVLRSKLVVFGGVDRPGGRAITDTWEWDGQEWQCVWGCK